MSRFYGGCHEYGTQVPPVVRVHFLALTQVIKSDLSQTLRIRLSVSTDQSRTQMALISGHRRSWGDWCVARTGVHSP